MSDHIGDANKMISGNHLPDTGKMVSDTPRTDAASAATHGMPEVIGTFRYTFPYVEANFARQLENELNAANIEIEKKRKDVVWLATEKAKSENYVTELENRLRALWDKYDGDRKHYMDRIKRLEEAGDRMVNEGWNEPHLAAEWRKAKEAKP